MLRATAVAAGARIFSPSDAASFIKATQTKNVVHFKPTSGSSTKSSMPAGVSTHLVCTGPKVAPTVSHPGSVNAASPTVQQTASAFPTSSNLSSEPTNAVSSSLPSEILLKQEVKTAEEIKVSESGNAPKQQLQGDGTCVSANAESKQIQEDKAPSANTKAESNKQVTDVKNDSSSSD